MKTKQTREITTPKQSHPFTRLNGCWWEGGRKTNKNLSSPKTSSQGGRGEKGRGPGLSGCMEPRRALRQVQTLRMGPRPLRPPLPPHPRHRHNEQQRGQNEEAKWACFWGAGRWVVLPAAWCRPPRTRAAESRRGQTARGRRADQAWGCTHQIGPRKGHGWA